VYEIKGEKRKCIMSPSSCVEHRDLERECNALSDLFAHVVGEMKVRERRERGRKVTTRINFNILL